MIPQHFIFDLDGTLWNTVEPCTIGWNKALDQIGHSDWHITASELQKMVGRSQLEIFTELFPRLKEAEVPVMQKLCNQFQSNAIREMHGQLYPGVLSTFKELLVKQKSLYVVSNCEAGYIELFLNQENLQNDIVDFESWGRTRLTKSENIQLVIERNHLKPNTCIYIGDTQGDCDAAQKAGIDFVWVTYGFGNNIQSAKSFKAIENMGDIMKVFRT